MAERDAMVACLSMPDNLHQLAVDIEDIQNRLLRQKTSSSPDEQLKRSRRIRSRSMMQLPSCSEKERDTSGCNAFDFDEDEYYLGSFESSHLSACHEETDDLQTRIPVDQATITRKPFSSVLLSRLEDPTIGSHFDEGSDDTDSIGLSLLCENDEMDVFQGRDDETALRNISTTADRASACLKELLLVIGAVVDFDAPQVSDGTSLSKELFGNTTPSKSPCSVIPDSQDRQESHPTDNNVQHPFIKLSPERRANSMPIPRSKSSFSSTQTTVLPRKSSLKNISSALAPPISTPTSSTGIKRVVSFNKLQIREYNLELSDHPSCSCGPPIQLGWEFRDKAAMPVEEYEEKRLPRRNSNELVLSYNVRRYLLLKRAGYSKQELKRVMEDVNRVKRERLMTDLFLPMMKLDETFEEIIDQIKATFSVKRKEALRRDMATR